MASNILLITADQLRSDALGCYGNTICRTPHLDALAQSGCLFENSFTPNPICVPAKASITTGNYSHFATGTKDNCGRIHDNQPKLAWQTLPWTVTTTPIFPLPGWDGAGIDLLPVSETSFGVNSYAYLKYICLFSHALFGERLC